MHACMHAGTMQDRWEMSWRYLWNHRYLSRTYVQASCFHLLTKFRRKTENVQANAPWPRPCPQKQRQPGTTRRRFALACLSACRSLLLCLLCLRPSVHLPVRPPVRPPVRRSVRPSVRGVFFLSLFPSVRRSLDWLVRRSLGPSGQARSQPRACVTWRRVTSASTRDARGCVRGCL